MPRTRGRAGAPLGRTSGSYRLGYTCRGLRRGLTLPQAQSDLQIMNWEAEGMKEFRVLATQEQLLISMYSGRVLRASTGSQRPRKMVGKQMLSPSWCPNLHWRIPVWTGRNGDGGTGLGTSSPFTVLSPGTKGSPNGLHAGWQQACNNPVAG